MMLKRKTITLPSGAKCVIRPLKPRDLVSCGTIPDILSQAMRARTKPEANPDIEKVMEFECHVVKASLLKACGFILDSENQKYAIVDKAPIDCLPSEICIEEIEQEDANMIFKEVMELSQWAKEAASAAQTFPEESRPQVAPAPDGENLRQAPE
jgi:hypothetical protein